MTLLVLGTWGVALDVFLNVRWVQKRESGSAASTARAPVDRHDGDVDHRYARRRRRNGSAHPLVARMDVSGINVEGLTRMLFWYFGHPLVYFWIMGAYLIWYLFVPTTYGGKIFSGSLTRLTFLILLIASTPVRIAPSVPRSRRERGLEVRAHEIHDVYRGRSRAHDRICDLCVV